MHNDSTPFIPGTLVPARDDHWFAEATKDRRCTRCGSDGSGERGTIEWHHRDPKQKRFDIGSAWTCSRFSKEDILKEIAKCDALCACCHQQAHGKSVALGSHIRRVRTEKRISQRQLAILVGISRSYMCDIEHGRSYGKLPVLARMARALGISISEFIGAPTDDDPVARVLRDVAALRQQVIGIQQALEKLEERVSALR